MSRNGLTDLKSLTAILLLLLAACQAFAENSAAQFPVGSLIPHVTTPADQKQSYALYLPSNFTPTRNWPIIYVFDPFARGDSAAKVVQAAAERFGYIIAASNNSRNGPAGGSREAAQAMWNDTQQRLPIDPNRRYFAGLSGGARVATSLALNCGCAAGVIGNAAGFPVGTESSDSTKFAYFATVGDADFNFEEFAQLRPKLDASGIRYVIRTFDGPHGWAPGDIWMEALEWMDIQAMATGSVPRDPARIQAALDANLARASKLEVSGDSLAAFREYQSILRSFRNLADIGPAQARLSQLEKSKSLKAAQKQEKAELEEQARLEAMPSSQMAKLPDGELDVAAFSDLRAAFADLKQQASGNDRASMVKRRALSGLVVQAFESGENSIAKKDYRVALQYFDLAATGSANPAGAHYERARVYAIISDKKNMLSELNKCLAAGVHNPSALDAEEFHRYRDQPDFRAIEDEWKAQARP
jgi:hypothetical protein